MSKKIKMELSSNSIKETIKKLIELQKDLGKADEEIVKQLSDFGLEEIQRNYANTPFKDGNEDVSFYKTGSPKKMSIGVTGSQVLYNEFGTGTEGANNPHPTKGNYELKGYNTGETIRTNKSAESNASQHDIPVGGLYWTYTDENGQKQYTQGIPAQKEGYTALESGTKKAKNFIRKRVQEVLDDFN